MSKTQSLRHDELLDCIGQACPLPVLRARKALARMKPGKILLVLSSDPVAVLDLPHMAAQDGHRLLGREVDDGQSSFWLERGST